MARECKLMDAIFEMTIAPYNRCFPTNPWSPDCYLNSPDELHFQKGSGLQGSGEDDHPIHDAAYRQAEKVKFMAIQKLAHGACCTCPRLIDGPHGTPAATTAPSVRAPTHLPTHH